MRILIDLKEEEVAELDAVAKKEGVSRAALMRQAISEFLGRRRKAGLEAGFGAWKKAGRIPVDGLIYQEKIRKEWSGR